MKEKGEGIMSRQVKVLMCVCVVGIIQAGTGQTGRQPGNSGIGVCVAVINGPQTNHISGVITP